jgi:hypothetical protein
MGQHFISDFYGRAARARMRPFIDWRLWRHSENRSALAGYALFLADALPEMMHEAVLAADGQALHI